MNRPRLLLLDEPLSALDANLRRQMQVELKSLQREVGISFMFVTHDQEEAMVMSDRIALLRTGELEQVASPREIYNRPATAYTAQFIGHTNLLSGEVKDGIARCGHSPGEPVARRPRTRFHCVQKIFDWRHGWQCRSRTLSRQRFCDQAFHGATELFQVECADGSCSPFAPPASENWSGDVELEFSPADAVPVRRSPRIREPQSAETGASLMFSRAYRAAITVPPLLWVAVFLLVPYAAAVLLQLLVGLLVADHRPFLDAWTTTASCSTCMSIWQTLLRSMWIAARVTFFSLLLGYPLAYFLSFYAGKRKNLLYQLVIIPLWVSYLVRAYAWKTILGTDGVLNTLLQYVHLTSHPLDFLLYSPFAVVLTLTHIYTPFTFLPIYASLEHIPRNLVEASHDLGASPLANILASDSSLSRFPESWPERRSPSCSVSEIFSRRCFWAAPAAS